MTTTLLHLFNLVYRVVSMVAAILNRATPRRFAGALLGDVAMGVVGSGIVGLGECVGWWHYAIPYEPYFLTLLLTDAASCAFIYLLTWQIARRFGGRGLAVVLVAPAVIGPARDHAYLRWFPEWGHYGPGIAPFLVVSASYVVLVLVGHGVMRLVAGPARADRLARRPWVLS